jgi:hypothetical protein
MLYMDKGNPGMGMKHSVFLGLAILFLGLGSLAQTGTTSPKPNPAAPGSAASFQTQQTAMQVRKNRRQRRHERHRHARRHHRRHRGV